jgi:hypothetical protein
MKLDLETAIHYFDTLDSDAENFNTMYEDVARYFLPQRSGFLGKKSAGEEKTDYLMDSIGPETIEDLSNYIASVTTPAGVDWFGVSFRDKKLMKVKRVKEWSQEVTRLMHQEISESNFEAEASEYYKDYSGFGTASMRCTAKTSRGEYAGLSFKSEYLRGIRGMENQYGELDLTFFESAMTAKAIQQQFAGQEGVDETSLPVHDDENPQKMYQILHCIYPRDDADIDEAAYGFEDVASDALPFGSMWINYTEKSLIKESGYYEPARSVARWYRNADAWNGYSPALLAMPDVRELNAMKRLEKVAVEKNIDKPILTESNNAQGDINSGAGKITTVDNINGTRYWDNGTDFNVTMFKADEMRQAIRMIMFTDIIREPLGDSGQKTAFEIAKRMERANRLLGQAMSRLRTEFVSWTVLRVFSIMYRNNRLPEIPEELGDSVELDIRYTSPIAISQSSAKLDNIDMLVSRMLQIASARTPQNPGADPIWDYFSEDGWMAEVQDVQNTPATIIRSEKEVQGMRQERQQAEQQANQMAMAEQASGVVRNIGAGAGEKAGQEAQEVIKQSFGQ